jgi:hypothetical protein
VLEREFLSAIDYDLFVGPECYARCIRSLLLSRAHRCSSIGFNAGIESEKSSGDVQGPPLPLLCRPSSYLHAPGASVPGPPTSPGQESPSVLGAEARDGHVWGADGEPPARRGDGIKTLDEDTANAAAAAPTKQDAAATRTRDGRTHTQDATKRTAPVRSAAMLVEVVGGDGSGVSTWQASSISPAPDGPVPADWPSFNPSAGDQHHERQACSNGTWKLLWLNMM